MSAIRIAGRYAKSLIDLSVERGQLESVFADMQWLQAVCNSSRDFVVVLKSPVIKGDKKQKILESVTSGKISELTAAFNRLLIKKGRESFLPEIIPAFISQYKEYKNIYTIKLTTAAAISDDLRNAIVDRMKQISDMKNIELETAVNDDLIGGFVLQAGDQLVDASIAYDLKNIARQFDNNDFVYKIR